ncbi:protein-glutamate methylesterase/protein-glutamine glutaminase [Shewanella gelidii]|uniref:Protein-glutamate methylesterase/protein-glutamine glutaminase n=1 Tax=Shewanella gelidii TaxID=1642821 RepID=A0A917JKF5_9GAMM|nr:chemotaxis response regulator protein-glutamate methylesterase [Shewanella gelidii]MCL1096444.1 chemotaxis response regulator protein-glutamate methylesterase [Shewanella gelidii]GGI67424.1 chemotaxis response regulator protein-glutamate methylesterase of group 1 operon [Shewanella gelidii]
MGIKVLIVDDSSFFRRRVSEIVKQDPELEVIGTASNGAEAVQMAQKLSPQVITMDIEMPVMDGITAVKKIMESTPTPILMFSSLTHDGAKATLDALEAGALDFLPKRFEDIATNKEDATKLLQQRVKALGRRRMFRPAARPVAKPQVQAKPTASRPLGRTATTASKPVATPVRAKTGASGPSKASGKHYKLLLIGTSTGGPVALQKILTQFPANYPHPILLVQHMPAAFTPAFANRLNGLCKIGVKEAENGDVLRPGQAYLAPGGMQMMIERSGGSGRLKVIPGKADMNYKPSVDITFASASKAFSSDVLAVVLTGMGADGREGARMLKSAGAVIWAQDEASCVVYGMPQAVTAAGISTQSIALDHMADAIIRESGRG